MAETTRGAVQSIPREQRDAAAALGFRWVGSHAYVILPQALRRLLPPLVSLLVNIIQNTTLVAVIGGLDMLEAGKRQNERLAAYPPIGIGENHAFEIFGAVALLFFLISFPLTRLAAYLEKRLVVVAQPHASSSPLATPRRHQMSVVSASATAWAGGSRSSRRNGGADQPNPLAVVVSSSSTIAGTLRAWRAFRIGRRRSSSHGVCSPIRERVGCSQKPLRQFNRRSTATFRM